VRSLRISDDDGGFSGFHIVFSGLATTASRGNREGILSFLTASALFSFVTRRKSVIFADRFLCQPSEEEIIN
jgi:hypothetical protein